MVSIDGYTIIQHINANAITIQLPQTDKTLATTAMDVSNRKLELTDEEEQVILAVVRGLYESR